MLRVVLLVLLLLYALTARNALGVFVLAGIGTTVVLLLIFREREMTSKRQAALQRLILREDCELSTEYRTVSELTGLDTETVQRLWGAVAGFYGVPLRKLRASDQLAVVLSEVSDVDHDIYLSRIFREGQYRRVLGVPSLVTWADLVAEIHRLENECRTLATKTVKRDGAVEFVMRE